MSGQTIRGYQFQECIRRQGFAEIYRALQTADGRTVAIKVINHANTGDPGFLQREALLLSKLDHASIVPLIDSWSDATCAYIVIGYVSGGTLEYVLKHGALTISTVDSVLARITSALDYIHNEGIVHRDIKPAYILLDDKGNAFLGEFGIARNIGAVDSDSNLSGTFGYMSPQQIHNEPASVAMDVYSLGIMLYQMLTCRHPFEGATAARMIQHHLQDPMPDVREQRPDLPPEVDAVIQKACAKKPDERYDSAGELFRPGQQR